MPEQPVVGIACCEDFNLFVVHWSFEAIVNINLVVYLNCTSSTDKYRSGLFDGSAGRSRDLIYYVGSRTLAYFTRPVLVFNAPVFTLIWIWFIFFGTRCHNTVFILGSARLFIQI